MSGETEEILPAWEQLGLQSLNGILMVVGASDAGKSTFGRYLFRRLCASSAGVAYLDGDPGQGSLGPPTTMTLALAREGEDAVRLGDLVVDPATFRDQPLNLIDRDQQLAEAG
jgi:polynucleotide 5'-kinase involved in rRNA processing